MQSGPSCNARRQCFSFAHIMTLVTLTESLWKMPIPSRLPSSTIMVTLHYPDNSALGALACLYWQVWAYQFAMVSDYDLLAPSWVSRPLSDGMLTIASAY